MSTSNSEKEILERLIRLRKDWRDAQRIHARIYESTDNQAKSSKNYFDMLEAIITQIDDAFSDFEHYKEQITTAK